MRGRSCPPAQPQVSPGRVRQERAIARYQIHPGGCGPVGPSSHLPTPRARSPGLLYHRFQRAGPPGAGRQRYAGPARIEDARPASAIARPADAVQGGPQRAGDVDRARSCVRGQRGGAPPPSPLARGAAAASTGVLLALARPAARSASPARSAAASSASSSRASAGGRPGPRRGSRTGPEVERAQPGAARGRSSAGDLAGPVPRAGPAGRCRPRRVLQPGLFGPGLQQPAVPVAAQCPFAGPARARTRGPPVTGPSRVGALKSRRNARPGRPAGRPDPSGPRDGAQLRLQRGQPSRGQGPHLVAGTGRSRRVASCAPAASRLGRRPGLRQPGSAPTPPFGEADGPASRSTAVASRRAVWPAAPGSETGPMQLFAPPSTTSCPW